MLERNPGLLGSHSNNFSVYTERVTALAQWAPPTLDLNKVPALQGPAQQCVCHIRLAVLCLTLRNLQRYSAEAASVVTACACKTCIRQMVHFIPCFARHSSWCGRPQC